MKLFYEVFILKNWQYIYSGSADSMGPSVGPSPKCQSPVSKPWDMIKTWSFCMDLPAPEFLLPPIPLHLIPPFCDFFGYNFSLRLDKGLVFSCGPTPELAHAPHFLLHPPSLSLEPLPHDPLCWWPPWTPQLKYICFCYCYNNFC